MQIVLIGSGNVATRFGIAFQEAGHKIVQVYSRTKKNAGVLAAILQCGFTNEIKEISPDADLFFVALTDEATKSFLKKFNPGNKLIVHTAGSLPMRIFHPGAKNYGVIWPMKSFTKEEKVEMDEVTFFVEGSNKSTENIYHSLAKSFSNNVHKVNSKQRFAVHLAAVFANNFPNHLLLLSEKILKKEKLSLSLFYPMIINSAAKLKDYNPAELQTGPAKRGDRKTLSAHLKYLSNFPEHKKIYKMLSDSIRREK